MLQGSDQLLEMLCDHWCISRSLIHLRACCCAPFDVGICRERAEALQLSEEYRNTPYLSESAREHISASETEFQSAWADADACVRRKHEQITQACKDAYNQAIATVERCKAHQLMPSREPKEWEQVSELVRCSGVGTCTCELMTFCCVGVCIAIYVHAASSTTYFSS